MDHAVYDLALALRSGIDVNKDPIRSHKLMVESAINGEIMAMSIAGSNFLDGVGTKVNREAGLYWLEEAANRGDENAGYRLSEERLPKKENYKEAEKMALKYMKGDGVEKNLEKELIWLTKAAAQGSTLAKMRLSHRYAAGEGVEKSDINALYWMVHLTEIRPVFQTQADEIAKRMSGDQIEHTEKLYVQCGMSEFLGCVIDEI